MQHNNPSVIRQIAFKEIAQFFTSPTAYLFLASFSAITLFTFFWGDAFFARNIADVRPLFESMPLLLIFLASALTMRMWSEEKRTGTIEHIFTQPTSLVNFVFGKFYACMILLLIALLITLPLPITVSMLGDLDWGPVWAGYLATLLLGACYIAIGLFVSSKSENQIVSLITSVAVCGIFYALGSPIFTALFNASSANLLRSLSTGARFNSIARGVLDFGDLYYYLSLTGLFLALNTYTLEKQRWSDKSIGERHSYWRSITVLLTVNLLLANIWLDQVKMLRVDVTRGKQFSISQATKNYLVRLQEPLLIRGYFSAKTHPLLAPLVPQLKDLIEEYQIAGGDKVKVEIVDPVEDPEIEKQANQKYGIKPSPFQVADRYQSSIVSSYFDVLVEYGDQHQVLNFRDLIEVKSSGDTHLDVQLRNPEHDLTSAIRKVLNSYQSGGNLFDTVKSDVVFNAYISKDSELPEKLKGFKASIQQVAQDYAKRSKGRLKINIVDPENNDGEVAKQIAEDYGFQPMVANLLSEQKFYFYLTLGNQQSIVQIPLDQMTKENFENNLKAGIQHFASGFTKTVALVVPKSNPQLAQYGMEGAQFRQLKQFLGEDLSLKTEDLSDGAVSGDADILLLIAPKDFDQKQLFAVDQFLMQGGTVIAATSPYSASFANRTLNLQPQHSGLEDWLKFQGINIQQQLVLDEQNAAFPVPVTRNINGFQLREMKMLDYPYFVDVRDEGLNQQNPITDHLVQTTMAWSSPIEIDQSKQGKRKLVELLHSSEQSWLSNSTDIMPKIARNNVLPFMPKGEQKSRLLGVVNEGVFDSFFAKKKSPLMEDNVEAAKDKNTAKKVKPSGSVNSKNEDNANSSSKELAVSGVIKHSTESARLVVLSSNDFLRDQVMQMAGAASGSEYLNNSQLIANILDWSLDDQSLMSIRSRGHFNQTLPKLEHDEQLFWEYLNYLLAAITLGIIALVQRRRRLKKHNRFINLINQ